MKLALIALVSCLALSVKSYTYMGGVTTKRIHSTYWTDKAMLPRYKNHNIPVVDTQSTDLICRSPDMTFQAMPFRIDAGDFARVTWKSDPDTYPYHNVEPKGPCTFWLAPASSKGKGKVWSKIHQYINNGKDGVETKWCTDIITANKGFYDVPIPTGLAKGTYILRSEIIDIRDASVSNYDDFSMGPRFHPNCLLIDVYSIGDDPLKSSESILEVYKPYYKSPMLPETTSYSQLKLPGLSLYPHIMLEAEA
ncbi:hypothetical protein GGI10_001296 [Coemansia sp. RSA 2530]|nr:hypothetical protein GGI10_001296 [Coemansia sp. RSA 2530]